MSARTERKKIIRSGDPIARHSLNQRNTERVLDGRKKFFGTDEKAAKAERRRWEQEQFLQDLPRFQFNRALGHIFDGTVSDEDIDYVARNVNMYEHITEQFRIEKSNGKEERITPVAITVVDFVRIPKEPLH